MTHSTPKHHAVNKGRACLVCDIAEPCIHQFSLSYRSDGYTTQAAYPSQMKTPLNHITGYQRPFQSERVLHLTAIDYGAGADITLNSVSQCSNGLTTCPTTYVYQPPPAISTAGEVILQGTGQTTQTLFFLENSLLKKMPLGKSSLHFGSSQLSSLAKAVPLFLAAKSAISNQYRRYGYLTQGCDSQVYSIVDVYPSISFLLSLGWTYHFSSRKRTDQERREEQISRQLAAYEEMKKKIPKDKTKLRSGWTKTTDMYAFDETNKVDVGVKLEIQNIELSQTLLEAWKKGGERRTGNDEGGFSKLSNIFDSAQKYLLPSPNKANATRGYQVAEFQIEPIKLGLAYGYDRMMRTEGIADVHYLGLIGDPLFGFSCKIDLLQLIAMYCPAGKVVTRVQKYLKEKEKKAQRAKRREEKLRAKNQAPSPSPAAELDIDFNFECVLEIKATAHLKLGASIEEEKKDFSYGKGNKLELSIRGWVDAYFKATVLFFEGAFKFEGEVVTKGGFELDQHDNGLDIAGYHDGIKAKLSVAVELEFDIDKKGKKINSNITQEFIIAKPLKSEDSYFRLNVIGEKRALPQPKIESSSRDEFYKWYANHWASVGRKK